MEFSEITELRRVLRSGPSKRDSYHRLNIHQKMIDYDMFLQEELRNSPPCSIPKELASSLPEEILEKQDIIVKKEEVAPQSELQVKKEANFKETYYESINKVSMLAQSIMEENNKPTERRRSSDKANTMDLTIYLFGTVETMKVSVPYTATIEQLISRIVTLYMRSEMHKVKPLPKGPVLEAYQIWLIDEETSFPDTDFTIDRNKTVKDLDTEKLAFCALSGTGYNKSVSVLNSSTMIDGIPLKIFFEDTWIVVGVGPEDPLKAILTKIEAKFPKIGYMNPSEYEFRVEVSLEDLIEKEECIVDMDLPVSSLSTDELRLYKKVYADTPAEVQVMKKEIPIFRETDEVRYDPTRFNMSRAQACAYKEYEVIKTNKKNKRQKRILGINQLRLFNMTVEQAKQAVKEKAAIESSKQIFKKKIVSIFKSVTQHPEIPIENIHSVHQDPKNLSCLYIEYTENNIKKRKMYETEKSSISAEIVAKISKLMTLQFN